MAESTDARSADRDLIGRLKDIVGPKGLIVGAEDLAPYLAEPRGLYESTAPVVALPASTDEVSRIVTACNEAGVAIVPQGGNTGLVGGAVATGEIVVNLGRMNRIREIDPLDFTMTVEAGCILADIQKAAAERDRLFPLSLGAEGSCQIGGNISTNAGGTGVLRYGAMRELTLGLEVVLPEGRVWNGLRRLRKDNTGYDLKQVFVGAEGTLGIITAAVLKLFPAPRERHTAFAAVRDPEAAIELLTLARETSADAVAKFELVPRTGLDFALLHIDGTVDPLTDRYDHYVLVEFWASTHDSGLGQALEAMLSNALEAGLVLDATIAQSEAQRQQLWHIREAIVLAQRHEGASIKNDIAVPVSAVPVLLRRVGAAVEAACPGIRPCPFGHVGDGNIHYNLTRPIGMADGEFLARWDELTGIVNAIVDELDGSFSAEHGIGKLKRADLKRYRSPIELELMRTLKHALDPHNRMNPGKIV